MQTTLTPLQSRLRKGLLLPSEVTLHSFPHKASPHLKMYLAILRMQGAKAQCPGGSQPMWVWPDRRPPYLDISVWMEYPSSRSISKPCRLASKEMRHS